MSGQYREDPVTTGTEMTEPMFFPEWYALGVRSQETGEHGGDIGNAAYLDWMAKVLTAATGGRKVEWTQVGLAVVLDRMVRQDEARRDREGAWHGSQS